MYNTLANTKNFKPFIRGIEHTPLIDVFYFVFANNCEVKISEITANFGNGGMENLSSLQNYGLCYVIDDVAIIPLEFAIMLSDEYINLRHPVPKNTLISGIYSYDSSNLKEIVSYVNHKFHQNFDTSMTKIYLSSKLYVFYVRHKEEFYKNLTDFQRKVLEFMIFNGPVVNLKDTSNKFFNDELYSWGDGFRKIFKFYKQSDYIEGSEDSKRREELRDLYVMGFLVPAGSIYNRFESMAIPEQISDLAIREYNKWAEKEREEIYSKILSAKDANGRELNNINVDFYENVRKILIGIASLNPRLNQNGTMSRKFFSEISHLANFDEYYAKFLLAICIRNKFIKRYYGKGESKEEHIKIRDNVDDLIGIDRGNFMDFHLAKTGMYLEWWNIMYMELVRYAEIRGDNHLYRNFGGTEILLKEIRMFVLENLEKFDFFVNSKLFFQYLSCDLNFKKFETEWNNKKYTYRGEEYKNTQTNKNLEIMFDNACKTLLYLGIVDAKEDEGKTIIMLKLSKFGNGFIGYLENKDKDKGKSKTKSKTKELKHEGVNNIVIQANNEILVNFYADFKIFSTLGNFAYPKKTDKLCIFGMDKESVMKAYLGDFKGEDIIKFLKRYGNDVPQTIVALINSCSLKYGEIEIQECSAGISFKDEILMREILADKNLSSKVQKVHYENVLLIKNEDDVSEIYKRLKQMGYGARITKLNELHKL